MLGSLGKWCGRIEANCWLFIIKLVLYLRVASISVINPTVFIVFGKCSILIREKGAKSYLFRMIGSYKLTLYL